MSLSWTAPAGTVTGLAAATTYSFAVTATNSAGESPKSGSVSATTSAGGGGGGEAGIELAQSCTNLSQLTAAYQSVINTSHVTHIDFDIEGAAIADTADNATR